MRWEEVKTGVNQMFPVKPKPTPGPSSEQMLLNFDTSTPTPSNGWETIEAKALAKIPIRYRHRYHKTVIEWLGTEPAASLTDTTPAKAFRVSAALNFGGRLVYTEIEMPTDQDLRKWAQHFVSDCGLGMELQNAAGEVVAKFTPQNDLVAFI